MDLLGVATFGHRECEGDLNYLWLVVWNINFIFPYTGNFIIPTDELIFFRAVRGVGPPTRSYFRFIRQTEPPFAV